MRIEYSGIQRIDIVLNGDVVEAFQPFALEESLRGCPVRVAVLKMYDEAMISMRQFVEA
jgi:hypothetical protein